MNNIAILFPGQGSQYVGMGKTLYENYRVAKDTFEEANEVLGIDLKNICFEGSLSDLNKMENMLTAILTTSVAAFRVYHQQIGIDPEYMAGHSLGEYSALTCSGVIDFKDALELVKVRSQLAMEAAKEKQGVMTIVENFEKDKLESLCRKYSTEDNFVDISLFNSSNQFGICGNNDAVLKVEDEILDCGGNITPLMISAPFHCRLMEDKLEVFKEKLLSYNLKYPTCNVISNVEVKPYSNTNDIVDGLVNQLIKPVQWNRTIEYLKGKNIEYAIDMGPQSILKKLLQNDGEKLQVYSFNEKSDKEFLINNFSKEKKEDNKKDKFIAECIKIAVCTKNKNLNNDEYEKGVVENYRLIESMKNKIEEQNVEPTVEEMKKALDCLSKILETKKVDGEKQVEYISKLLLDTDTLDVFPGYVKERDQHNEK